MARPESFNDLARRKSKNKTKRGKDHEKEIRKSLERLGGFTKRFPDVLNVDEHGRRKDTSTPSPPDYIHLSHKAGPFLVECKAVKGKLDSGNLPTSVDFDTVSAHQLDDLRAFWRAGGRAAVAFCLYNDGIKRCWMIPIYEWLEAMNTIGEKRKSVPLSWFTDGDTWGMYEVEWMPGKRGACYDLEPFLNNTSE